MVDFLLENPVLLLGAFLTTGYLASFTLHKIGVPHIISYLGTGLILSNTLFVSLNLVEELDIWFTISESVALGLIGFKIGTELKIKHLKREPRFVVLVTLAETTFAFLIVFSLIFLISHDILFSIILGGLATATAPAATTEVFRKLRAKGQLTTRIKWLLAFDDVVAIIIVEGVLAYLITLVGGEMSFASYFAALWGEIGISLLIGLTVGYILDMIIDKMHEGLEMMELTLAVLILVIGLCYYIQTSILIATMTIGAVATNIGGENYKKSGDLLEVIMSPIVMLFFVLVGAKITISDVLSPFPWIALIYLLGRSVGKISGAYIGASKSGSEPIIKNNLGLGLLAQGGVSLGLVSLVNEILANTRFEEIGKLTLTVIIVSTFFSVIIGSFGAKLAVERAGEVKKVETTQKIII